MNLSFHLIALFASSALSATTSNKLEKDHVVTCGKDLTAEQLKTHPKLCEYLNAECMSKINMTDMGRSCIARIPAEELNNMKAETANQIMSGKLLDLPADANLMKALMKKNEWTKFKHEAFLQEAASRKEYAMAVMSGLAGDHEAIAKFFSGSNADKHSAACPMLNKEVIGLINTTFFTKMSKICFKAIPADAFEGFDAEKFGAVRPDLLHDITVAQATKLTPEAISGMKAEQIKAWGPPYNPPDLTDKDGTKAYLDAHPCSQANRMLVSLKKELQNGLRTQCKLQKSSAKGKAQYSSALFGACVIFAVYLVI